MLNQEEIVKRHHRNIRAVSQPDEVAPICFRTLFKRTFSVNFRLI